MYVKARVRYGELRKSRSECVKVCFPGYLVYCLVVLRACQACSVLVSVAAVVTELCPWTIVSKSVFFCVASRRFVDNLAVIVHVHFIPCI